MFSGHQKAYRIGYWSSDFQILDTKKIEKEKLRNAEVIRRELNLLLLIFLSKRYWQIIWDLVKYLRVFQEIYIMWNQIYEKKLGNSVLALLIYIKIKEMNS